MLVNWSQSLSIGLFIDELVSKTIKDHGKTYGKLLWMLGKYYNFLYKPRRYDKGLANSIFVPEAHMFSWYQNSQLKDCYGNS